MFQSAKVLEEIFSVEAAFYKLRTGERTHLCRSLAAIRRRGTHGDGVDALFVLLNPGKCLPVDGEDSIPMLTGEADKLPLLAAAPDNTMLQLMRLMERMNWNGIEVINLTDIRTGKFADYHEGQKYMERYWDSRHTIFSIDRYPELLDIVERADSVIAGWGTKAAIRNAAEEAHIILSELAPVNGVAYENHPLYYHPFPWLQTKCIKWLDHMEKALKRSEQVAE
ncbi:DUF1643 domain-containing protein [Planococcus salinarum]|uniref:DUF1643 domain-containing protein n=1 Tax=Planococcus salinarum TaxID=622695 RepID=UPI000E3C4364|nr:DUF1643 domain-containing protein [Planococcus salinarum]TAA72739.1 DUF1643 domain-containing protein [Planococcus salinarum]